MSAYTPEEKKQLLGFLGETEETEDSEEVTMPPMLSHGRNLSNIPNDINWATADNPHNKQKMTDVKN